MSSDVGAVSWDDSITACELHDHLELLKDKYDRLFASHQKLLRINQGLEDKLLRIVDRYETDRAILSNQVTSLNSQLLEAKDLNRKLIEDNERYKSDISVATRLLHCNSTSFAPCKLSMLPLDLQEKAKAHVSQTTPKSTPPAERQAKVIRVPISAFPPTTVIYSVPSSTDETQTLSGGDEISASVMAKILEERQRENSERYKKITPVPGLPHSRSMTFLDGFKSVDQGTQTYPAYIGETERNRQQCVYCRGQQQPIQIEAPPLIIFTETETTPLHKSSTSPKRNGSLSKVQQRRRPSSHDVLPAANRSSAVESTTWVSIETDI